MLMPLAMFGQEIGLHAGINYNTFFDFEKSEGHFRSSFESEFGYITGLSINELSYELLSIDLSISYEKYQGKISVSNGGQGGGNNTSAIIELERINIGINPFHIRLNKNKLKLNIGFEYSYRIKHNLQGTKYYWNILPTHEYTDLNNETVGFLSNSRFALDVSLQYKIEISQNIFLIPRYEISYAFTFDVLGAQVPISNFIQRFTIGISKHLENKK